MNTFCLVGKIARLPVLKEGEQGWKYTQVLMEVERPFANGRGIYETDLVNVEVYRGAAETMAATASLDQWICARGRIQSRPHQKDGRTWLNYSFVADNIEYIH